MSHSRVRAKKLLSLAAPVREIIPARMEFRYIRDALVVAGDRGRPSVGRPRFHVLISGCGDLSGGLGAGCGIKLRLVLMHVVALFEASLSLVRCTSPLLSTNTILVEQELR